MKNSIKYALIALALLIGGAIFYNKVYIPKSTYATLSPKEEDMKLQTFGIGNVGAKEIYNITALTASKIKALHTDEGEWVKKGQLLVEMDAVDLPELVAEAKISVKKAKMEVTASRKDLDALYAQRNLALVTYDRYKKLKIQSFASQSEYDKAKADLDAIKAQIAATKAHINSALQEVKRSQTSVKALEVKLSRYKIYAPVDGYVITKEAEVAQSVVPTQSIFKIVNPQDVWIRTYIDERISGNIKVGQHAHITLRSQAGKKFAGVVKRIVAESDAVTQEREVDVAFEKLPIPFYINEQAEVLINTKTLQNVVTVPTKVIVHKDGKSGVWIAQNSKAHFQKVKVLGISGKIVAVKNLATNAVILVPATNKKPLHEGARVH
ncbi:efflux RND transporter periplasmic adaptor subunit [Sulfurimonas sp.]|uniref:efflux RND transporter periplasmic adaptor subunit n=1 Tax=Sulfurimonas sp. TaxID=2022749 RepID=UPI00261A451D|nr:efflux RND transporter periplasmic adaptor subunit [Sulfurimonas sp.]